MRKAVLLIDLDDTLIPDVPAAREAIAGTLRSLGLAPVAAAVDGVLRWTACCGWRVPDGGPARTGSCQSSPG